MNLPSEARCKNLASRQPREREHCRWCADSGLIVVSIRRDAWRRRAQVRQSSGEKPRAAMLETGGEFEEYAPCPFCEQGQAEEFPIEERYAPWGKDGYWRGRSPAQIEALNSSPNQPFSIEENAARMRELGERLGYVAKEMPA